MAIYKNKLSQKAPVYAYTLSTGAAKTGDAANITAQVSKDGGSAAATNDVNPAEADATNLPGVYLFDLTQAETNCDLLILAPKSSTSGVALEPLFLFTEPEIRDVNTTQISGDSTVADTLESLLDGGGGTLTANITGSITGNLSGSVGSVTGAVGSVTGAVGSVTGNVGGSVGSVATGGITSASFAAGAINAAAIATGAIDADAVAADAGTEIATAVWALATRTLTANTNLNDPTAAAIADAVWDEVLSGHAGVGSTGAALSAAGGSGDPWSTALPGAYGAGTAGKILGDNLNATVGSRSSHSAADVWAVATRVLTAGTNLGTVAANVTQVNGESVTTYTSATLADAVWDEAASGHTTAGTTGKALADVLVDTAEIGTAGAGLTALPWNAAWDAEVQSEVADALAVYDPPTNAEMEARTLAAANYATAAALATVDTVVDSILDDTGTAGVVVAAGSKTGYALAATGLDSIAVTAPTGVATTFPAMVVQLWRRFFKRATTDAGTATLKTYADDGTTAITTQSISDDGNGNEVQGAAS
jgi:hypothetical protein